MSSTSSWEYPSSVVNLLYKDTAYSPDLLAISSNLSSLSTISLKPSSGSNATISSHTFEGVITSDSDIRLNFLIDVIALSRGATHSSEASLEMF